MGRANLAKAGARDIIERLNESKTREEKVKDYLKQLKEKYSENKISYSTYVETIHKKTDGRNLFEHVELYRDEVKKCKDEIARRKKNKRIKTFFIGFFLITFIIFLSLTPSFEKITNLSFTGFATNEKFFDFSDQLNLVLENSTIYEWTPKNPGKLNSISLSGLIQGDGDVKIYLENILIFEKKQTRNSDTNTPSLTGNTIGENSEPENQISYSEETQLDTTSPEETKIEEASQDGTRPSQEESSQSSETQSDISNNSQTSNSEETEIQSNNPSSGEVNKSEEASQDGTRPSQEESSQSSETNQSITQLINSCTDNCNLEKLNLNKTSYQIKIELSNATLYLNEVNYEIISEILPEENPNEVNLTQENLTITTTQYTAKIGEPVKWKKIVSLENPSNITIELPKEAGNIVVNKIIADITEENKENYLNKEFSEEEKEKANSRITGEIILEKKEKRNLITGKAVDKNSDLIEPIEVLIEDNSTIYEIEYETPAPYAIENEIEKGKRIEIIGPETIHYENVLSFTNLNEELNIKDQSQIKIYWIEENSYLPIESLQDTDSNGIYDYIEWIIPHLSNQTFEIILIKNAQHLSSNKTFISDIYEEVKELDNVWSEIIPENDYIRVTFEENLTNINDITIYPRIISGNPEIEVYEKNSSVLLAKFENINSNEYNKVYLTNLIGEQDTFDLKIIGGSFEFDHIIDPEGTYLSRSFDTALPSGNAGPFGITQNGTFFWITDLADDEVYKYYMNGTYAASSFDTAAVGLDTPCGLDIYGNHIYIAGYNDQAIYMYWINGTYYKILANTSSYNRRPEGLAIGGNYIYTGLNLAGYANIVYRTWINGTYTQFSFNASLSSGGLNGQIVAIESDGDYLWITDATDDAVYKYWVNGTYTQSSFSVSSQSGTPYGLTMNQTFFWLVEYTNAEVYIYEGPEYSDISSPTINFESPTPNDDETITDNFVYLNTTITDSSDTSSWFDWNKSLVGYWSMDYLNTTGIFDNASYNNFATFNGLIPSRILNGIRGNALNFDGNDDYLEIPQSSSLNISGNQITLSTWFRPDINRATTMLISKPVSSSSHTSPYFSYNIQQYASGTNEYPRMWVTTTGNTSGAFTSYTGDVLDIGRWYHIVGVYNGTHICTYINGSRLGNCVYATGNLRTYETPLRVGINGGLTEDQMGTLDEVMVFDRALSVDEIKALYNNSANRLFNNFTELSEEEYNYSVYSIDKYGNYNKTNERKVFTNSNPPVVSNVILNSSSNQNTTAENLTVYYNTSDADGDSTTTIIDWRKNQISIALVNMPFDIETTSTSSNAIKDYSSFGNNGTIIGSISSWVPSGKVGGAYFFNNEVGDEIIQINSSDFDFTSSQSKSFFIWFKKETDCGASIYGNNEVILTRFGTGNFDNTWWFGCDYSSDHLMFQILKDSTNFIYIDSEEIIDNGQWHHGGWAYDGSDNSIKLYLDGKLVNSSTFYFEGSFDSNYPLCIGAYDENCDRYEYEGYLDELIIFNHSLSEEQVSELYNSGLNNRSLETLVSQEISNGDNWTVALTPNEGSLEGSMVLSNEVSIPLSDLTPPTYSQGQTNSTIIGESTLFSLNVNDGNSLETNGYYIFSTNNTGSWINDSAINFTSTPQEINAIKILNSTIGTLVGYMWYLVDNSSNKNNTEIFTLLTRQAPTITFVYPTPNNDSYTEENYIYLNATISSDSETSAWFDWNDSLIAYFGMDSYNSTGILDQSPNNNLATFNGNLGTSDITSGKKGDALNFDRTTSTYLSAGEILPTTSYTKSSWIYMTQQTASTEYNILSGDIDSPGGHAFWVPGYLDSPFCSNTGGTSWAVRAGHNNNWCAVVSDTGISLNTWTHVALTYDSATTTMNLYVNGVLEDTNNSVHSVTDPTLQIGGFIGANLWHGNLDEVLIFNRKLSDSEIQALYNSSKYSLKGNFTNLIERTKYNYTTYAVNEEGNLRTESNRKAGYSKIYLIAFGDSITDGYGLSNPSTERWGYLTSENISLPLINIAQNGASVDNEMQTYIQNISSYHQNSKVVFMAGTNDIVDNTSEEAFITDYKNLVQKALDYNYNNNSIYLLSIPWSNDSDYEPYIDTYNEWVYEVSQNKSVHFINLTSFLKDNEEYLQGDGLHPNTEGHELIANITSYYILNGALPSSSCGTLSTANTVYTLTSNVTSTGTCFIIGASNITLDCNNYWINFSTGGANTTYGVVSNQFNTTVKNCNILDGNWSTITSTARRGIYYYGATNGTIINNSINVSSDRAIYISVYSNNTLLINNTAISNLYQGIMLNTAYNTTLINNTGISNASAGIRLEVGSNNTLINNTGISNSSMGIYLDSSLYNNLIGNNGSSITGIGIYLYDNANYNNFTENIGMGTSEPGFQIYNSNYNNFTSNTGIGTSDRGFYLSSSNNSVFINNTARSTSSQAIRLIYSSNNNTLINNNAMGGGVAIGITHQSSNNVLINNTFNGEGSNSGVTIENTNNNTLINNTASVESATFGIRIHYSTNCVLENNTVSSTTGYGIFLNTSTNTKINLNNATTISGYGIYIWNSSYNNLTENIAKSSSSRGIYLYNSSYNDLTKNTGFSGEDIGIYISTYSDYNNLIRNNATGDYGYYIYNANQSNFTDCMYTSGSTEDIHDTSDIGSIKNTFLNCSYDTEDVNGASNILIRKWYFDANASYSNGTAIEDANLTIYNESSDFIYSQFTDSNGDITRQELIDYVNTGGTKEFNTPHTVTVSKTGFVTNSTTYNLTTLNNVFANIILYLEVVGENACGILSTPNRVYTLTSNVSSTGTCFTISAANITLDCNNYWINYSTSGSTSNYGVYINRVSNATIKNCNIFDNNWTTGISSRNGIRIDSSNYSILTNNFVNNSDGYSIYLINSSKNILINNTGSTNSSNSGIYITSYSSYNNLTSNIGISNEEVGIYITGGSNNNLLFNNTGRSEIRRGIQVYNSTNNNLTRNIGISNSYYGIQIGAHNNNFLDNTGISISSYGINLDYGSGNNFTNNTGTSTSGYGFYITDVINNNFINNTGRSLSNRGFFLSNSSNNNLTGNAGYSNSGYGVYLAYYSNYNTLINNTGISNSSYGIYLSNAHNNNLNNNSGIGNISIETSLGFYLVNSTRNNIILTNATGAYAYWISNSSYSNFTDCLYTYGSTGDVYINSAVGSIENIFLNCSYDTESVNGATNQLIRKWYFDANVTYANGTVIENANLTIYNSSSSFVYSELTNSTGDITRQELIDYINTGGTKVFNTPHTVEVSKAGLATNSINYNLTTLKNTFVNIILGLDGIAPQINWEYPTPNNNETITNNFVYLNTTITDSSETSSWFNWDKSLIGYWSMDYFNSTHIFDNSTYENNGSFNGGLNYINLTTGKRGNTLKYDGINDYLNIGNSQYLKSFNEITLITWAKFNYLDYSGNTGTLMSFAGKGHIDSTSPHSGFWFSYDNRNNGDSFSYCAFGDTEGGYNGGGNNFGAVDYTFETGVWYQIVVTIDSSSEGRLFVNGAQIDSTQQFSNLNLSNINDNLYIGRGSSSFYFNGSIDEFMIFNRSLSEDEIKALYNNTANRLFNNFTDLSNVNYNYSVYSIDEYGNYNKTDEREVTINSNQPPQIYNISKPSSLTLTEGPAPSFVVINFSVLDENGANNLNSSTASINLTKSGEALRFNQSCSLYQSSGNYANYTCNITMWWFDASGEWQISANITDLDSNTAINTTENLTVNTLTGFVMNPSALSFSTLTPGTYNQTPSNHLTLNNTGNQNITSGNVRVNATDLRGETNSAQALWAGNFSASPYTGGSIECNISASATQLVNMTDTSITNVVLPRGNYTINNGNTGQEKMYFCLREVGPELSQQKYSTGSLGSWTVRILLVAISFKRKKKSKKNIKSSIPISIFTKDLGVLETLSKYLKENLQMSYHEIAEILNRDERTIWTACKKANEKHKSKLQEKESKVYLPLNIFKDSEFTTLETIVFYLKQNLQMKYSEIGELLNRDERNIWTIYSRIKEKPRKSIENLESKLKYSNILEKGFSKIPISIFTKKLGVLETLSKYLKENLQMSYHEIAKILNRDERTIWTACKKANEKHKSKLQEKESKVYLPLNIFKDSEFTTLETIVFYLKQNLQMKYSEIGELLNRDERNIWTIYSRIK